MTNRKILIIAPFAFGYTSHICRALNEYETVDASILYLDKPAFVYRNLFHRVYNFVLKSLFRKNLKKVFVHRRVKKGIMELGKQDVVFIIRPDLLDNKLLGVIKDHTTEFVAYYYDSTRRFPRKVDIIPFFDKIFSYDREDVKKFGFEFLTNYIFAESEKLDPSYQFFNISTYDLRFLALERLAGYIRERSWSYKILVYNGDDIQNSNVEFITKQLSIEDVSQLIEDCKIILEIQRSDQVGLSFRTFEALGHRKKLVTTNRDIVNYDFYNAQNILVVNEDAPDIPAEFVDSPYVDIEESILSKYRVENWVKPIFNL